MAGRRVEGAVEAERLLAAVAESGLERAAWARSNGINPRSLNAWRLILARRAAPLRLVELVPSSAPPPSPVYRVRVADAIVEVERDFEDEVLARLLRLVAAC